MQRVPGWHELSLNFYVDRQKLNYSYECEDYVDIDHEDADRRRPGLHTSIEAFACWGSGRDPPLA